MTKRHKRYALFIGRWQPFHLGHKYLVDQALKKKKDVAIAIRDTELSEKNPYTLEQRTEMIKKIYGDKVLIVPICDIESINIGRKVGYDVNRIDAPQTIQAISGTKVRKSKSFNDVPEEIKDYLASISPTFWFFGLPCSGKSTLAKQLIGHLQDKNQRVMHFDGDTLRNGLNQDLKFTPEDRRENLRRAAYIAKLFNEQGHSIVCSFVTPLKTNRKMIAKIIPNVKFIYVKCSLNKCIERDVKGMYKKAKLGLIKNFTGISAPFEAPKKAAVVVDTEKLSLKESMRVILEALI